MAMFVQDVFTLVSCDPPMWRAWLSTTAVPPSAFSSLTRRLELEEDRP